MAKPVKCLYCGESFYKEEEPYQMVGKRYVHQKCYNEKQKEAQIETEIHDMMKRVLGVSYTKTKINQQLKSFKSEGKTVAGIYRTLVYFYDVKKNDPSKANGGIGIVPYVYVEAQNYFKKQSQIQKKHDGRDISNFVDDDVQVIHVKKKPVRKPMRTKFFELH